MEVEADDSLQEFDTSITFNYISHSPRQQEANPFLGKQTAASQIVEGLLPFRKGVLNIPALDLLQISLRSIYDGLALAPSIISRSVVNASGLIFLNLLGNSQAHAAFGVYDSYFNIGYLIVCNFLLEKGSIGMSQAFGQGDFEKIKDIFTKSCLTFFLVSCCYILPLMCFPSQILTFLGFPAAISTLVGQYIALTLPFIAINSLSEILKIFCLSQSAEKIFGYSSIASTVINVIANYYVMVKLKYGVLGWIAVRTVLEVVNLIITLLVYMRTAPASRGFVQLHVALDGFWPFVCESLKFLLGVYPEFLGFHLTGYFIALSSDSNQMAAYYSTLNLSTLLFTVGIAFGITTRSRMNILIGMREIDASKNYYKFSVLFTAIIGLILGTTLYLLRFEAAQLFASSTPAMQSWFLRLQIVLLAISWSPLSFSTCSLGLKCLGKLNLMMALNFTFVLVLNLIFGLVVYRLGGGCDLQFANYEVFCVTFQLLCFVVSLSSDWSTILPASLHKKALK